MVSSFARELRQNLTDAERRLWKYLRLKQVDGFRFRRQQPIGPYTVDFFCSEAKLIVEADGGQHADDSRIRTDWLEGRGYRVIRFWNNDILSNTDGVLSLIRDALSASPLEGEVGPQGRVGGDAAALSIPSSARPDTPHPSTLTRRRPPPQGGRRYEEGSE